MSLLSDPSNWVTSLVNVGADAMSNLYYVDFTSIADSSQSFTVRNSEISGLPEPTHKTETKSFQTIDIEVPKCEYDLTKKLTLTFRLDKDYNLYTKLLGIMRNTSMPSAGYATTMLGGGKSGGDKGDLYNINIKIPQDVPSENSIKSNKGKGSNYSLNLYEFNYCWISKISGLEDFSYDSSNSRTIKVDVYYFNYKGPESTLSTSAASTENTSATTSGGQTVRNLQRANEL